MTDLRLIQTTARLRDGREVKVMVEPGAEAVVSRQTLVQLLIGGLQIVTGETGKLYRDDWTERVRKALALERGARR